MCEALHMPVFAMLSEGARVCVCVFMERPVYVCHRMHGCACVHGYS